MSPQAECTSMICANCYYTRTQVILTAKLVYEVMTSLPKSGIQNHAVMLPLQQISDNSCFLQPHFHPTFPIKRYFEKTENLIAFHG